MTKKPPARRKARSKPRKTEKKRGPKEERLIITEDPIEALRRLLAAKKQE